MISELSKLNCHSCNIPFQSLKDLPVFLSCGHSICKKCHHDKISDENSPCSLGKSDNRESKNTHEEIFTSQIIPLSTIKTSCKFHKVPENMICEVCYRKICFKCSREAHFSHEVDDYQNFLDEMQTSIREHNEFLLKNKEIYKKAENDKNEKILLLQTELDKFYDHVIENLHKIKNETRKSLDLKLTSEVPIINLLLNQEKTIEECRLKWITSNDIKSGLEFKGLSRTYIKCCNTIILNADSKENLKNEFENVAGGFIDVMNALIEKIQEFIDLKLIGKGLRPKTEKIFKIAEEVDNNVIKAETLTDKCQIF